MPRATALFSTFVPEAKLSEQQGRLWLAGLLNLAQVKPDQIAVHRLRSSNTAFDADLARLGVNRVAVTVSDGIPDPLQKLCQLETLTGSGATHSLMMSPALITTGPLEMPEIKSVAAKIVDRARPGLDVIETIFKAAGLPMGAPVSPSFAPTSSEERTQHNNCNNRLYVFRTDFLKSFAPVWRRWAGWCAQYPHLFGGMVQHMDQISFALAMAEARIDAAHLPLRYNYPAHLPKQHLRDLSPACVFVHNRIDAKGLAKPVGLAKLDASIARINAAAATVFGSTGASPAPLSSDQLFAAPAAVAASEPQKSAPQTTAYSPVRAGVTLANPQSPGTILPYLTSGFETASRLQIGLADTASVNALSNADTYQGFDTDTDLVASLKRKNPALKIRALTDGSWDHLEPAELVIVLDQSYNVRDVDTYLQRISTLAKTATKRLIIRGLDYPPRAGQVWHGSLSEHLMAQGLFQSVIPVWRKREDVILVCDRFGEDMPQNEAKKRGKVFADAAHLTEYPLLLTCLADLGRKTFGFFSTDFLRAIELPWILHRFPNLDATRTVIDLGSGHSPLPLFAGLKGASVITVDKQTAGQKGQPADWGFFDYGQVINGAQSIQADLLDVNLPRSADVLTAVNLPHLLSHKERARMLARMRDWVKPDGDVFVSFRLIPNSLWLWPYAGTRKINHKEIHGHLIDFRDAAQEAGLAIVDEAHLQGVPNSVGDLWMAHMRRD